MLWFSCNLGEKQEKEKKIKKLHAKKNKMKVSVRSEFTKFLLFSVL